MSLITGTRVTTCVIPTLVGKQINAILEDAIIWGDDIIQGSSHYHLQQILYRIDFLQRLLSVKVEGLSIFLIHLKLITYYTPKISEDIFKYTMKFYLAHITQKRIVGPKNFERAILSILYL